MAYEELKQRQGAMWGSGPYQRVTDTIADGRVTLRSRPGRDGTASSPERADPPFGGFANTETLKGSRIYLSPGPIWEPEATGSQAEDAVRARDEFLSVAAHELKTPIASIKGFCETLLDGALESALRDSTDVGARERMLLGAHLAGAAIEKLIQAEVHAAVEAVHRPARELDRADPALALGQVVDSQKPDRQRQLAVLEHRAGGQSDLPLAAVALEQLASLQLAEPLVAAGRAGQPLAPAHLEQSLAARLLAPEPLSERGLAQAFHPCRQLTRHSCASRCPQSRSDPTPKLDDFEG